MVRAVLFAMCAIGVSADNCHAKQGGTDYNGGDLLQTSQPFARSVSGCCNACCAPDSMGRTAGADAYTLNADKSTCYCKRFAHSKPTQSRDFNSGLCPKGLKGNETLVVEVAAPAYESTTSKDVYVPIGLKIDLTAEEMDAAMALNTQYEKEFAEGNYVGPANISAGSGMTKCNQVCSNWCWATGATMAASAFGGGSSCSTNEEKVAEYIYGTPCSTSCPNNCNQGGTTADIANGIKYLSGHSYKTGNVLSQSALDSALKHGPVVVGVQWSVGGGHAITLSGKSGGKYKIHDPEGEDHTVEYNGVTTYVPNYASGSYTGKWFGTAYTSSGTETVV